MVKKKVKIIWDDEAKRSLRNIYNYIKRRESVNVAKKFRNEIVSQAKTLNDFPEKFEREYYLEDEPGNFRYKVIWSYKIIYEVTKEAIYILDIFHTSRDPSNIKNSPNPHNPTQISHHTGQASFGTATGKAVFVISRQQKFTPSHHSLPATNLFITFPQSHQSTWKV